MSPWIAFAIIALYFSALFIIARYTSRGADTNAFFTANKQSPWYLVAFGMIGTSLSGVTFISVPGAVAGGSFSYFQVVLGYLVGYFVIATVLMPMYYRLRLVSIYSYLQGRFGFRSYKTGAFYFIVSRTLGSALRLYLAAVVLQLFLFDAWGVPFFATVIITLALIWAYTYRGGLKTIVWTDTFQTFFLVTSLIVSVVYMTGELNWTGTEMLTNVWDDSRSQIFFFEWNDSKNFYKQFIGGAFIALCMTGLDQDLMQKNLSCRNISEAQKNMFWFTLVLTAVNYLFLVLGALLYIYADTKAIELPLRSDYVFPALALHEFGAVAGMFFLLGIIASSFASSDSALAALTTSFCYDFLDIEKREEKERNRLKTYVHLGFSVVFLIVIVLFQKADNAAVITVVLKAAAYTYGPLLGLYGFGLLTGRRVMDNWVPVVCVAAPVITFFGVMFTEQTTAYRFSFEILPLNGLLTAAGLYLISSKASSTYGKADTTAV